MRFAPFYIQFILLVLFIYLSYLNLKKNYFYLFQFKDKKKYFTLIYTVLTCFTSLGVLTMYLLPSFIQTEIGYQLVFAIVLSYCLFWVPTSLFSIVIIISAKLKNNGESQIKIARFFILILIAIVLYGVSFGKYDYQVIETTINYKKLPKEFNGFKIVQISDAHLGSLNKDTIELQSYVKIINSLKPDLICFTGDLVNCRAEEIRPFIHSLRQLKAKFACVSVFGNHDFGEHFPWKTKSDELANINLNYDLQTQAGFKVLLDTSLTLKKGQDSILIIGIRNWSLPPFPSYGNFEKASENYKAYPFSILLSHDPTHWLLKIKEKTTVDLTLSGHTHGAQFGWTWNNKKYSPIVFKFPLFGGLYQSGQQFLYVNVGIGFLGLPARIGMRPEISVLKLNKIN